MSIDLSRVENILETMLGRSEIKEPAQSRVEELLIELKEAIEEGGTGGDITALTARIAKCERDISSIETVDETQTQQIQSIVTSLGEFRTAIENLDTDVENKADKSTTYTKTEVDTALSAKQDTISDLATIRSGATLGATAVQPISGKGLSTNDFTNAEKTKLDNHVISTNNPHQVTKEQVGLGNVDNTADIDKPVSTAALAALSEKVDKETGKGLSTNDFTTAEKEKLAGIEEQANKTVVDSTPTLNSTNPVASGGLFAMFRNTVNRQSVINGTGDLNSAIVSGFYKFNGGPENAPGTGAAAYGMLIVFDYDNYILQLCYRYDTQSLYVRYSASTGSSWGTWKELQLGS